MKFHSETAKKIAAYVRKNPKAKPKDVAQTLGVKIAYVYNIKNRIKNGRHQVKEGKRAEPSSTQAKPKVNLNLTPVEKLELIKALEGWQAKYTNDPRMPVFKDKAKPMPLPNSYNDVTSEIVEVMKQKEELRNQVLDCKAVISYLENAVVALIKKSK